MDIINNRRSVRNFLSKKVEKEKIELLLRAGMQAPSAMNQQPWIFLVIEDDEKIKKLQDISRPLHTSTLAIVLFTDKRNLKSPHLYTSDMGAATQNMLLEAANLNLGGCWIGLYNREDRLMKLANVIKYPDYLEPFSLIAFGYPSDENANHFVDRYDPTKVFYESI